MKESYWGYWLILLGIFVIGVMMLVNSTTTTTTQDYYMLKEVTQASMIDAVDLSYYRLYGDVKMSEEKFVENFLRRFAENNSLSKTYTVEFYDIYEVPPKVSVKVSSVSNSYNIGRDSNTSFDIVNKLDAILEYGVDTDPGTTSKYALCPMDFTSDFIKYVYSYDREALRTNYPELYSWVVNGNNDKVELKNALNRQFPDLKTSSKENLMAKYDILRYGFDNHLICTKESPCN